MQLDIFNDSRDVMLRNDLLQALQQHDAAMAHAAWLALQREYVNDALLASAQVLLDTLQAHTLQALTPIPLANHAALKAARLALLESVAPVAHRLLGQAAATLWLQPFWQKLLASAASLSFETACEEDHVAPMRLFLQDWQGAADAVARIESWRRISAPLASMAPTQPGQHSAPDQAMRLLVNFLGLERQGRYHDLVAQRKNLRELNGWLYGVYLRTR